MNFNQIECFKQVMLHGSMSAAAKQIDMSQSMVSRSIASLEAELGIRLFNRTRRGITPTEKGHALYVEVQRSFRGLDVIAQAAHEIKTVGTGRLQIASVPIIANAVLPMAIATYMSQTPDARVSFEMRSEITVYRWVSSGICDIGFSSIRRDPFHVEIVDLYSLKGVCALPKTHRLARRSHLSMEEIVKERLILPPQSDLIRQRVDYILRNLGLVAAPIVETPYAAAVCSLVDQGIGIGVVNPLVTGLQERFSNLVLLPLLDGPEYEGFQLTSAKETNSGSAGFCLAVRNSLEKTLSLSRRRGLVS